MTTAATWTFSGHGLIMAPYYLIFAEVFHKDESN